jgi:sporulation protein YlmC with PRC-barrel domain
MNVFDGNQQKCSTTIHNCANMSQIWFTIRKIFSLMFKVSREKVTVKWICVSKIQCITIILTGENSAEKFQCLNFVDAKKKEVI